ncbi:MAG: hypothetical protein H5U40_17335, partial [Polyangiaceae bacterium]|nr:hypothetical protein [Polyangiaceae bacterium]
MTARSAFVLAAVVVACGFARTSLEAQPRRQCPDPAPLYALRHLDADGMRRAFGLDARPWTVRLVSVLPPTAQRCHLAVARAELWRQTDSPRNAARVLLEARAVTLEMGIGPNGPAPVGGAPLDPADPRG